MIKKTAVPVIIFILLSSFNLFAEEDVSINNNEFKMEEKVETVKEDQSCIPLNLSFEMTFNTKDILLGFDYSLYNFTEYYIFIDAMFYFRPYKKTVFVKEAEKHYYQLKEDRYAIGLNVDKIFRLYQSHGIYLSAGAAYTFGDFSGTDKFSAESGYTPVAGCGYVIIIEDFLYMKMGYQYIDIPEAPPNRAYLEISFYYK